MCWIFFFFFFFFIKDNVNEWVTFACDGTGPADESKRTKRVQGWSRLNWLGGILIIVSWHIHFNKLLMPVTPVCCFAISCKVYYLKLKYKFTEQILKENENIDLHVIAIHYRTYTKKLKKILDLNKL